MVWVFEIGFAGVKQILMTRLEVEDEHSCFFGCWYEIVNKYYFWKMLNKARLDLVVDVIYITSLSWIQISLVTFNCIFLFLINKKERINRNALGWFGTLVCLMLNIGFDHLKFITCWMDIRCNFYDLILSTFALLSMLCKDYFLMLCD